MRTLEPPKYVPRTLYAARRLAYLHYRQPMMTVDIFHVGTAEEAEHYAKPLWDFGPVSNTVQNSSISYPEISYAAETGLYDPVCAEPQDPAYLYPIGLLITHEVINHGPAPVDLHAFELKHLLLII